MKGRVAALVILSGVVLACAPWIGPSLNIADGSFIFWELRLPRALSLALRDNRAVLVRPLALSPDVLKRAGARHRHAAAGGH